MKKQTTSESSKSAILMDNSTKKKSSKSEDEAEAKRARAHSSKLPTDNLSVELQLSLIHEGETFPDKITLAGEVVAEEGCEDPTNSSSKKEKT